MDTRETAPPRALTAPLLAFAALVLLSLPYVFYIAFSHMSDFDDEGTLLIGFRSLLEGHRMYDEIYSLYGPLYNGFYRLLYVDIGLPLTHTTGRAIAAVLWVIYSAAFALVGFRMTGSRVAALFCYALTLVWLNKLMNSPGHPEEIALVILALLLLSISWLARTPPGRVAHLAAAAGAGALIAGLLLVKINVGLFAGECLLLLLLRLSAPESWTRPLSWLLGLLMLVTPMAVSLQLLDQGWVQLFVGFATVSIAATLAVFYNLNLPVVVTRADWFGVVAGGLTAGTIIIAGTLLTGSSAFAVLDAVVLQNASFMKNWFFAIHIPTKGGIAALLSLCLALAHAIDVRRPSAQPIEKRLSYLAVMLAKLGFIALALYGFRTPALLFQLLPPFCWMLMVVPSATAGPVMVLRTAAALLGTMLIFYAFPVAGHQTHIGALIPIIAVSVFGHDLLAWASTGRRRSGRGEGMGLLVSAALLLLLFGGVVTQRARQAYLAGVPVGLPGTALIRLPPDQVASLRWVTDNLRQCRSSYSMPGLLSYAFWTGHPLPTPMNINHILGFIRPDRQQVIVAALRQSPDLCIVYSDQVMRFFDRGQIATNPPLLHYIRSEFAVAAVRGQLAILKRSDAPRGLPAQWIIAQHDDPQQQKHR